MNSPRSIAVAVVTLLAFSVSSTAQTNPAVLAAVDLINASPESCRLRLEIQGRLDDVETMFLEDGRFVFDLAPVAWDEPLRRVRPDAPGIREYRFAQFSKDPLVTRFVVEVGPGWSCRHERVPQALMVICDGPPVFKTQSLPEVGPTIAIVRGIRFTSPVAAFDAEALVARSLGFVPQDMIRDGLPNFGSTRDDWKGLPRPHKGLDIYGDKFFVQAVAKGRVVGAGQGELAGGWVKISHGNGVETVSVHISRLTVQIGDEIVRGQRIAAVDGAVGNAVQPQLHFELKLDGQSVDPVPFIFEQASEDLKRTITFDLQKLADLEQERAARVSRGVD